MKNWHHINFAESLGWRGDLHRIGAAALPSLVIAFLLMLLGGCTAFDDFINTSPAPSVESYQYDDRYNCCRRSDERYLTPHYRDWKAREAREARKARMARVRARYARERARAKDCER